MCPGFMRAYMRAGPPNATTPPEVGPVVACIYARPGASVVSESRPGCIPLRTCTRGMPCFNVHVRMWA